MGKKNGQVGARIAALRRERGLTQEQLAEKLHVTRQTVSSWETANSYPDVAEEAVLLYLDDTVMAYRLDSDSEPVAIELDVPPMAINNRTLVPIRAVAESFDCDVEWDQTNQQVIITAE